MISNIRPDMIDYFLKPATASGEDENTVKNLWIKNFLIAGGITLGAVAIFLVRLLVFGFLSRVLLLFLCFAVVLDIYIVAKFIEVMVVRPKRYVKMVARYGRENLASQLSDTASFGFFIDEDDYDNLTVLTLDYLMENGEFVYALKDIASLTMSKHDVPAEQTARMKNDHTRKVLSCAYRLEITMKDGKKVSELIGLLTSDINPFFTYLQQRAPHIRLQYR